MTELDGYQVYGFFRAGSHRVSAARRHLDDINLFPVPDGDTGTNLSATLSGAVAGVVPAASAAATLGSLADAVLLSARGNSGVIFAQFVSGLSEAVARTELRTHDFARAVRHAYERARSAITDPREGTMLSIIEDWAASLSRRADDGASFVEFIGSTREDLRRSLAETTERLAELRATGFVDAGAAGFVEFVEGGHDFLARGARLDERHADASIPRPSSHNEPLEPDGLAETSGLEAAHGLDEAALVPPTYRYCTEAVVARPLGEAEAAELRESLEALGDCLIVARGRSATRVHLHTDQPERAVAFMERYGAVSGQKVDDMLLQYSDARDRVADVAIVTDSACDLPPDLILRHRVHLVPILVNAGGSEYLDKLTLSAAGLNRLAEGSGDFPKTAQAPAHLFSRLYDQVTGRYRGVVAVHLASALSGTYATSAREAARYPTVRAVDSKHLSGSLGLVVLRAAEAAEAGLSADEIAALVPSWSAKARILVSVTSLRYMVKGGRVSPLKGLAAKVLNLKPIVSVDEEGRSKLYGKSFSERANLRTLVRMARSIHEAAPLRYYAVGHSNAPEKGRALAQELEVALGFPPAYVTDISSVVALNAGPGAVSVVTMSE